MWRIVVLCLSLLTAGTSSAQSVIRLARIADIPDQFVGGEMLRAVYARLNIKLEFEDLPGKRALAPARSTARSSGSERCPATTRRCSR